MQLDRFDGKDVWLRKPEDLEMVTSHHWRLPQVERIYMTGRIDCILTPSWSFRTDQKLEPQEQSGGLKVGREGYQ